MSVLIVFNKKPKWPSIIHSEDTLRICLGFVAITFFNFDVEDAFIRILRRNENTNETKDN
jgi:hypothetical protein